jgi:hypothetical protein
VAADESYGERLSPSCSATAAAALSGPADGVPLHPVVQVV